jgi:hypothetical protein
MKHLILMFCLSIGFYSCQKDDNVNPTNERVSSVNEFLKNQNGFIISELIKEGTNKTTQFSNYLFIFNENGTVTAKQSNETVHGTYLVFRDDNRTELQMIFPNNSVLFELSDDWYFISQNATAIRFEDNSDTVQFQKE